MVEEEPHVARVVSVSHVMSTLKRRVDEGIGRNSHQNTDHSSRLPKTQHLQKRQSHEGVENACRQGLQTGVTKQRPLE